MGRFLVYGLILVLAVFLISTAFLLHSGGGRSEAVTQVSIHDLTTATQRYLGDRVTTRGVLKRHTESDDHFTVEVDELRIAVTGFDSGALAALEGQMVAVTGRFDFTQGTGRYIEAESVTPLP